MAVVKVREKKKIASERAPLITPPTNGRRRHGCWADYVTGPGSFSLNTSFRHVVNQLTSLFFSFSPSRLPARLDTLLYPAFPFLTMALVKFIRIFSVVSLAILHTSLDALPVNALIVERGHVGRDFSHAHAEIAKKRGDSSKKCRPRPSNAPQSAVATTTYHTTTTIPNNAPSSNPSEPAHTTSSSQPAPTNAPASSVNSKVMYAWSNNEQPSISNFLPGSGQTRLCVHLLIVSGFPPLTSSAQNLQLAFVNIFRYRRKHCQELGIRPNRS